MPAFRDNFASILDPGIRKIFGLEYAQHSEEWKEFMQTETSKKKTETDQGLSGTGLAIQKNEGQPITYDTVDETYSKSFTHLTYALGIQITREMWEDDQYRQMEKLAKGLAKSNKHTLEILSANVLNNSFTTELAADGVAICSTAHTTLRGGNYANRPSADADLDITSYEQMLIDLQSNFIDDRGLKMKVMPKKMIVTPTNIFQAQIVMKSAQLPGTANNDFNPAQGTMPNGFVVNHWLTDPDAWFVKTDVPDSLLFFWRRMAEFGKDNDFDTENAKWKTTFRCSVGCTDARGIYGTTGV